MTSNDIIKSYALYARNSGVEVNVNTSMEFVDIKDDAGASIFLQGSEAGTFIAASREHCQQCEDITMEDAYLAVAYPYLDLLTA